jgi:phage shock protein A
LISDFWTLFALFDCIRMLETKLAEARSKKDTLKARAASAKTSQQIQEMIGSLNTSNAVVAFEKMEEKVMAMEAQAETTAILVAGDKLEDKFALLESGSVEDELSALKKGMLRGSATPVAALPEGRPIRDAIDMELEELRRKARE